MSQKDGPAGIVEFVVKNYRLIKICKALRKKSKISICSLKAISFWGKLGL